MITLTYNLYQPRNHAQRDQHQKKNELKHAHKRKLLKMLENFLRYLFKKMLQQGMVRHGEVSLVHSTISP
ncbi:hypothetical protein BofuT4_uP076970.1 [Botrytis cinerea T4]|uniref:Uncharacterized protein n=1 Tax=Botryotinia fuckeliana (strain T4) TaxID=999810 RepID=G2YLA6_BOTF4|nr:hypothetical protein BofuT4_uP076970.1 [Botrytis cinerea T4]